MTTNRTHSVFGLQSSFEFRHSGFAVADMLKPFLKKIAGNVPLSVYQLFTRRDVLGFYYHVVSDESLPHIRHLYPYKSTRMFENDLVYLAGNYNLVSYEQLEEHYSGGRRLKPRSVILTFDDGLFECYSVVRPLLLKHGIPCVFFIPTDYIGNGKMCPDHKASLCIDRVMSLEDRARSDVMASVGDAHGKKLANESDLKQWIWAVAAHEPSTIDWLCRLLDIDVQQYLETQHPYMTADEIECLAGDGFTIGAHSVSHREFDSLTDSEVEEEIIASCKAILSLSGKPHVPFAFPFSADGVSRDMLQELRKRHERVGLFFDTKGILPDRGFMINRMCGDWPANSAPARSNLPRLLVQAYMDDLVVKLHRP
jgi:peptidoglycan/xylan/chitin deacetylase (PgdA/CDA1 family)